MPVEKHPGYPRWRAANDALTEARERLRKAPEHERAAAQFDYYKAQDEYDAAVDALGPDEDGGASNA
ncbi:hypothetical protein LJR219_003950 [Phenylobacterium sp. LjRoot219]|uniref:hypothetical protein n=1 Tax=Phenylobacterium sp. LjRoot219 TaxID=3342283 RepID=UPI003ECF23BD